MLHEPEAGVLRAQKCVQTLAATAAARGARVLRGRAVPDGARVRLDGSVLEADRVVWSCGSWLAGLFPGLVELRVTAQELHFFDGGPGWASAPAWVDYDGAVYGTGDLDALGVKVAWDQEGPPVDPDADLPAATAEIERLARGYAARRFPALADAPLKGTKTCRYELSPDSQFIAAPHPERRLGLDRRRRLGPRLQARAGDGRAARGGLARGGRAAAALRARPARLRHVVQERGLELTATNHGPS